SRQLSKRFTPMATLSANPGGSEPDGRATCRLRSKTSARSLPPCSGLSAISPLSIHAPSASTALCLAFSMLRSPTLASSTTRLGYRVTYHDPCMLGRYNGVYDQPRQVLHALGVELIEMPRNRSNSLCCGAGGGRVWMKELRPEGARRTSEQRIDEAVALDGIE